MKKTLLIIVLILLLTLCITGCKAKTLHCDHCGKEISVKESSNMEEDWIIYCAECNEELFDGDPLLDPTP